MGDADGVRTRVAGSILGHSVRRTGDVRLVTGAGRYADDVAATGDGLHAVFVRSPLAGDPRERVEAA